MTISMLIVDFNRFAFLGVPVIPTVAIKGKGIPVLTDAITDLMQTHPVPPALLYGKEVEERIEKIVSLLEGVTTPYPVRWTAIKLLERDQVLVQMVNEQDKAITEMAGLLAGEIESIHGEPICVIMSAERYLIADRIDAEFARWRADMFSYRFSSIRITCLLHLSN